MTRFVLDGTIAIASLTSDPVSFTAPTQAELTGGVDQVGSKQAEELVELTGFELQTSTIPTPGMAGLQTGNVGGEQLYPDSSMVHYKDDTSSTIYSANAQGNEFTLYLMLDGQASGEEAEGFPTTVLSRPRGKAAKTGHKFTTNVAIDVPYDATQAA